MQNYKDGELQDNVISKDGELQDNVISKDGELKKVFIF
jgi:hypothetical protein